MFSSISRLVSALRSLTDNILALSSTVRQVNDGIIAGLALDGPEDAPAVIDHKPDAEPLPHRRNGKARAAAE
jgi:hypothetical protein